MKHDLDALEKQIRESRLENMEGIEVLSKSQRAMVAARFRIKHGPVSREDARNPEIFGNRELCEAFNINPTTLLYARNIREMATPQQVREAEEGKIAVGGLGRDLKNPGITKKILATQATPEWKAERSKKARLRRLEIRELKAARTGSQQMNRTQASMDLWAQLRGVLEQLNGFPAAKDVVAAVRTSNSRTITVKDYLPNSIKWLEDFNNEWEKAAGQRSGSDRSDSRNGLRVVES